MHKLDKTEIMQVRCPIVDRITDQAMGQTANQVRFRVNDQIKDRIMRITRMQIWYKIWNFGFPNLY